MKHKYLKYKMKYVLAVKQLEKMKGGMNMKIDIACICKNKNCKCMKTDEIKSKICSQCNKINNTNSLICTICSKISNQENTTKHTGEIDDTFDSDESIQQLILPQYDEDIQQLPKRKNLDNDLFNIIDDNDTINYNDFNTPENNFNTSETEEINDEDIKKFLNQ